MHFLHTCSQVSEKQTMVSRRQLPLEQLIAATKKSKRKSNDHETQSTSSLSTDEAHSLVSCPISLPSRSLSSRRCAPSRSLSSRSSERGGVTRKVSFSDESHRTYSVPRMATNNDEKRALWFSKSEYKEMKNEMFQIATLTRTDGPMNETPHFSYRGLERMLSNDGVSELAKQSVLVHRDETMYALASARAVSDARQLGQTDAEDAAAYIIESFSESFSELVSMCNFSSDEDETHSSRPPRQRSLARKNSIRRIRQDPDENCRPTDSVNKKDILRARAPQRSKSYTTSRNQREPKNDCITHQNMHQHQQYYDDDNNDVSFRSLPARSSLSRKQSMRQTSRAPEERDQCKVDPCKQRSLSRSASQPGSLTRSHSAHAERTDPKSLTQFPQHQSGRFITVEARSRNGVTPMENRSIMSRRPVTNAQH